MELKIEFILGENYLRNCDYISNDFKNYFNVHNIVWQVLRNLGKRMIKIKI